MDLLGMYLREVVPVVPEHLVSYETLKCLQSFESARIRIDCVAAFKWRYHFVIRSDAYELYLSYLGQ